MTEVLAQRRTRKELMGDTALASICRWHVSGERLTQVPPDAGGATCNGQGFFRLVDEAIALQGASP